MQGRPGREEAAEYYFKYIDRVPGDDVVSVVETQLDEMPLFEGVSEQGSLHRYAPDKSLPPEAWARGGVASGYPFTVRSLAYILAGHFAHHVAILRERYLRPGEGE